MRTYEAIFIVHPEVAGDDQAAVIDKYRGILTDQGADVLKIDNWGVRTLAYPVKKQTKGCYVLIIFDAAPNVIAEFERRMRIDDKVIKFQTVLLENGYQVPAAEAEAQESSSTAAETGETPSSESAETAESQQDA